jgi:hypothetical protein
MTDINEKQLLQMIEKLLAGEEVELPEEVDAGQERLLSLARELRETRPQPDAGFEQDLAERLSGMRQAETAGESSVDDGASWFPSWVTWRRAAAVAATMVLGLGIAGMTNAVIQGNGSFDDNASVAVTDFDDRGEVTEKARSSEEFLEPSGADAAPPTDATGDTAGIAGGEQLLDNTLVIPDLRKVIQTADYEIEVPVGDFQDRYNDVTDMAAKYGGYVIAAESSVSGSDGDQLKQGYITIRIANTGDNFTDAQKELESLGKVVSRQISGEDVSEQYVDLQSRLRNAESQQAQLLALMEKAETIDEILMIQSRLDEVQMEIEQLKGSIDYLETQTDFATITVELYEEDVEDEADQDDGEGIDWGFVESIKYAGWLAVQTVNFVIIALGVIIPSLLIVSLIALVVYRVVQKRKKQDS